MKKIFAPLVLITGFFYFISCQSDPMAGEKSITPEGSVVKNDPNLIGTWKLLTGTLIEKGDTVVTDYTKTSSFIKIINASHFSFIQHDLNKGKDSTASFSAGAGEYTLKDSVYVEHLEYCNAREWEGHEFKFTVKFSGDTLVQQGIEVVESEGVNRLNIEKYIRVWP